MKSESFSFMFRWAKRNPFRFHFSSVWMERNRKRSKRQNIDTLETRFCGWVADHVGICHCRPHNYSSLYLSKFAWKREEARKKKDGRN
jgi:hypothetical protein